MKKSYDFFSSVSGLFFGVVNVATLFFGVLMKKIHEMLLPIKTVSEANSTEHWTVKNKRHILQKNYVNSSFLNDQFTCPMPCVVKITRIAPRMLDDHDNLRVSVKWIADQIAVNLTKVVTPGRADDDKRITWQYDQAKGKPKEYAVKIEFFIFQT